MTSDSGFKRSVRFEDSTSSQVRIPARFAKKVQKSVYFFTPRSHAQNCCDLNPRNCGDIVKIRDGDLWARWICKEKAIQGPQGKYESIRDAPPGLPVMLNIPAFARQLRQERDFLQCDLCDLSIVSRQCTGSQPLYNLPLRLHQPQKPRMELLLGCVASSW